MNRHLKYKAPRHSIMNLRLPALLCMRIPGILIFAMIGIVSFSSPQQPAGPAVPNPTVIGPIPATAPPGDPSHDYPFFATTVDLASRGYVEEEFFCEGTANRYNTSNLLATATILDSGHFYRTRMIVRRPVLPQSFNGAVVMELQLAAAGYDSDAAWIASHEHLIRQGYAWVGVSALQAGIHTAVTGLKAWNPSRYRTLDVTEHATINDDALSFDIFSQAAQAVRNPVGIDPMGGLHVELVLAIGGSLSAGRLVMYHNSIHPLAGVFDGFTLVNGGDQLRTDFDTKVFKILSESEMAGKQANIRQPDSDRFRRWEVAGASHIDYIQWQALVTLRARDLTPLTSPSCGGLPPFCRIPVHFTWNAALDHMVSWVKYNIAPPSAPDIELVTLKPTVVIARDSYGNALGGIRLSEQAVPTATNNGPACLKNGTYQPFVEATLDALYGNHGTYVSRVVQATITNLRDGFIVSEDAIATIEDSAKSEIGKP